MRLVWLGMVVLLNVSFHDYICYISLALANTNLNIEFFIFFYLLAPTRKKTL